MSDRGTGKDLKNQSVTEWKRLEKSISNRMGENI